VAKTKTSDSDRLPPEEPTFRPLGQRAQIGAVLLVIITFISIVAGCAFLAAQGNWANCVSISNANSPCSITILLTISGAVGGLASHLARHKGTLHLTSLGYSVGKEREAGPLVLRAGFFAEVILGIVAANSLHLAIGSIVQYGGKTQPEKSSDFALIAFGLLGGFAGGSLLEKLAKETLKLSDEQARAVAAQALPQVMPQVQAAIAPAIQKVEQTANAAQQVAESVQSATETLTKRTIQNTFNAGLLRQYQPTPGDLLLMEACYQEIQQKLAEGKDGDISIDSWLHASFFLLEKGTDTDRDAYAKSLEYANRALALKPTSTETLWAGEILRGLASNYLRADDWFAVCNAAYSAALAHADGDPTRVAITRTNHGYAFYDNNDLKKAKTLFEKALALVGVLPTNTYIFNIARLGLAICCVKLPDTADTKANVPLNEITSLAYIEPLIRNDDVRLDDIRALAAVPEILPEKQKFLNEAISAVK